MVVGTVTVPGEQIGMANTTNMASEPDDSERMPQADRNVRITIRKLSVPPEGGGFCVMLEDASIRLSDDSKGAEANPQALVDLEAAARKTLEDELRYTRDNLHTTIQDLETSNEELQAINEEMVASNEELQSTNEELHSVNEELYTVNAEHQRKIEELTLLTEDMENLFRSSDISTVFLEGDGSIRRSTPKANAIFGLNTHDQGRPLSNFRNPFVQEEFFEDVESALSSGAKIRKRVSTRYDDKYLMKIDPYRSSRDTSGVVLTLVSLSDPLDRLGDDEPAPAPQ